MRGPSRSHGVTDRFFRGGGEVKKEGEEEEEKGDDKGEKRS